MLFGSISNLQRKSRTRENFFEKHEKFFPLPEGILDFLCRLDSYAAKHTPETRDIQNEQKQKEGEKPIKCLIKKAPPFQVNQNEFSGASPGGLQKI